ncbi:DegT/DnrJ/EryC1/StrS family aminotransferase [Sporofaciens sp. JLR.KK001]|uniref:DegT/DnrJ/EryC1/StrS family aminotransferase n=1 Tax=Sporofaciens sp. JLR.KK001 TaxID=3112621 RepID=UPI002FEFB756
MKINLMDVRRQHEVYAAEYEEAALKVLRSGGYIGGAEVAAFEEEFAAYEGAKYGISCGNGTDAIVLALRALGIGRGDEVITVAWTFFATAESIAAVGATPVFIDVDPDTYCMDVNLVEAAITERTKAVLSVHFYGQSCDMDSLRSICKKHNLFLVADCAQSAGTKYKGERKHTLGDVSCFSFFPTKNLGGDGDGGMVLTDKEDIARACRSLKVHGSGKDGLWTLKWEYQLKGIDFPDNMPVGESKYYNYLIGYNSRLDAIQAAILRKKLTHMDEFVEGRRKNSRLYNEALNDTEFMTPVEATYCEHSYYIYALKHPKAQEVMKKIKEAGVPTGTYYPVPLHLQGAFAQLGYKEGDLPVTEDLSKTSFVLPVFPELYDEERNYIIEVMRNVLK